MPPDSQEVQLKRLEQYLNLFPLRTGSAFKRPEAPLWRSMSQFHSLTDDEIEDSLQNKPAFLRACPLGSKTKFAVLGVPAASIYSNPERISVITDLLRKVGLTPVLYGSASCDEIQIYLFFEQEMKTKLISDALICLLSRCGLSVTNENFVIYNEDIPLSFPLQQGFSWLNDSLQTKVCREEISFESALAMFCADIAKFTSSVERLFDFHSHALPVVQFEPTDQTDFSPPEISENLSTQQSEVLIVEAITDNELAGLIDHVLTDEEILFVQNAQFDFSPDHSIGMTPPEQPDQSVSIATAPKDLPYIKDFTQLTLPIMDAQSERAIQIDGLENSGGRKSSRKNKIRKRGPPAK